MEIVLVEDNLNTSAFLQKGLSEEGYHVTVAHDGVEGLRAVQAKHPQLVILDVMMPGMDGWTVLSEIRREQPACPVIMLTARDSVDDRVKGLELGADDYLTKPFAFPELIARIKNIVRRGGNQVSKISVGDLEIDLLAQRVTRAGQVIDLTGRELRMLSFLAGRVGQVASRRELADKVWGMRFDSGTNVVEVHIRRLRMKIDEEFDIKLIHTVRGMGYMLKA